LTADDLVTFWQALGGETIHPEDKSFLPEGYFQTHLHPLPWVGSIKHAKVFLCYLNPGYDPLDDAYERDHPDFVSVLRDNLLGQGPYFYLLNKFHDHPGHAWARKALGRDIRQSELEHICVLDLVPYHSEKGSKCGALVAKLPSSKRMVSFVREAIFPRAVSGEVALIIVRQERGWALPHNQSANIVIYKGYECFGGYVTPVTRGGRLMRATLRK
jgi:hypothetical protein